MRVVITVESGSRSADSSALPELRRRLSEEPELRGRVRRHLGEPPPPDAMGLGSDALIAVLAPGGVAAVLAGAIVAWVQSRRGDQTVTITTGEGTEITISTTRVRGLDARQSADLARELAAMLGAPPAGPAPEPAAAPAPEPAAGTAPAGAPSAAEAPPTRRLP
ncbi:hypothetical protein ACFW7J_05535 [Streptomyces sp. NPDC059525]|uniref:effector-associated constant component EACC1 n=1 Tax=Streptomyces sp. NPDC059525 TaxID=3346857 RepID=UPI003694CBA0